MWIHQCQCDQWLLWPEEWVVPELRYCRSCLAIPATSRLLTFSEIRYWRQGQGNTASTKVTCVPMCTYQLWIKHSSYHRGALQSIMHQTSLRGLPWSVPDRFARVWKKDFSLYIFTCQRSHAKEIKHPGTGDIYTYFQQSSVLLHFLTSESINCQRLESICCHISTVLFLILSIIRQNRWWVVHTFLQ